MNTKTDLKLDANKIKNALLLVHHYELTEGMINALRRALSIIQLNSEEEKILRSVLNIKMLG